MQPWDGGAIDRVHMPSGYNYWTLFTERVLNTTISLIWVCSLVMTTAWLLVPTDPPVHCHTAISTLHAAQWYQLRVTVIWSPHSRLSFTKDAAVHYHVPISTPLGPVQSIHFIRDPPVQWNFSWDILMSTVSGEKRSMAFTKMAVVYLVPGLVVVPGVVVLVVYAKIFVVVRRHSRAIGAVLPPVSHRHAALIHHRPTADHIGASAAKKLFIIYLAYWLMYHPDCLPSTVQGSPSHHSLKFTLKSAWCRWEYWTGVAHVWTKGDHCRTPRCTNVVCVLCRLGEPRRVNVSFWVYLGVWLGEPGRRSVQCHAVRLATSVSSWWAEKTVSSTTERGPRGRQTVCPANHQILMSS